MTSFANTGLERVSIEQRTKHFISQQWYVLSFRSGSTLAFEGRKSLSASWKPRTTILRQFHADDYDWVAKL